MYLGGGWSGLMQANEIIVFLGPTLPAADALRILPADYRAPAARGDVYQAVCGGARVIILIDGLFETTPSVFHKEVLWALAKGIHVFGAASMGALRAAELDTFGMVGVGKIYDAFRTGQLSRDDAVAVLHGPEELGYVPLTVALVDAFATLEAAESAGIVDATGRAQLQRIAEDIFYKERDYERIVSEATIRGCLAAGDALLGWVNRNHVSQKTMDAEAVLTTVARSLDSLERPFKPTFHFESTVMWHRLMQEIDIQRRGLTQADIQVVLNELVEAGEYEQLSREALTYVLAEQEVSLQIADIDDEELISVAESYRRENKLIKADDVRNWLSGWNLTHSDYLHLLADRYRLDRATAAHRMLLEHKILELLQRRGEIAKLLERAQSAPS
jgi:hypothetical protein